jgi:hypothetical protein
MNGFGRRLSSCELVLDHEGGNLGIGFGLEAVASCCELLAQGAEILDDAIVDDSKRARNMRMSIAFGRFAMRRPTCVADADRARERCDRQFGLEVSELALRPAPFEPPALEGRYARRIIPTIFEALQRIDNGAGDRSRP